MRTRRRARSNRVWVAAAVVVVVAVLVVGLGFYGSAIGLPSFLHSSAPSVKFSVLNVTLSSFPSPSGGDDAGMGAQVTIADHNTVKIQNATVLVNGVSLGTCTDVAQAGQQGVCKVGQDLSCEEYPAPPYAVKVTVEYSSGATESSTTTITSALTVYC